MILDDKTANCVRRNISYDKKTGVLANTKTGTVYGKNKWSRYVKVCVNGKTVLAHRAAWLLHYGVWPDGLIDHINGDRLDNRIANLRVVNYVGNARNSRLPYSNKSGRIGVCWVDRDNVWKASATLLGTGVHLGNYKTFEEACAARLGAEKIIGFHDNHGRKATLKTPTGDTE